MGGGCDRPHQVRITGFAHDASDQRWGVIDAPIRSAVTASSDELADADPLAAPAD